MMAIPLPNLCARPIVTLALSMLLVAPGGCDHTEHSEPNSPTRKPGEAGDRGDSPATASTAPTPPLLPSTPTPGPFPGFREIGEAAGVLEIQRSGSEPPLTILGVKSTGLALLDFDADGDLDLFLTSGSTLERWNEESPGFPCHLYRNLGGLRFEEVPDREGLPAFRWATGVAAADLDGDGHDDLIVTGFRSDRVFLGSPDGFREVRDPGLDRSGWSTSAACADLDGDGILDLFVARNLALDPLDPPLHGEKWSCLWENQIVLCGPRGLEALPDRVYRGRGDGTFEDVTERWGFSAVQAGYGLAVVIADLIGDASPEIFVANDSSANHLWTRAGERWKEVGFRAGVSFDANGEEQAGMGADVGDVDGDGRLDLVVTNFERESENLYAALPSGHFFDRSESWGLAAASRPTLSWGVALEDFDLDGDLDLFVVNGHVYPQADSVSTSVGYAQAPQYYRHERDERGNPRFVECGAEFGMAVKGVGRGCAVGDLDGDGDLDLVVSRRGVRPWIFENRAREGRASITLRLRQPGSKNREAIGAEVVVRVGEETWIDSVRRQASFQASGDPRLVRGHPSGVAGTVEVRWPDGTRERFPLEKDPGAVTLERGRGKELPRED